MRDHKSIYEIHNSTVFVESVSLMLMCSRSNGVMGIISRPVCLFASFFYLILAAPAFALQPLPLEPVALPPAVEQGVDMVYIDPEIAGNIRWRNTKLDNVSFARYAGAPLDLVEAINPLYTELRKGLVSYQKQWAILPQFSIPPGPALTIASDGERVTLLRERLGLAPGSRFDEPLAN